MTPKRCVTLWLVKFALLLLLVRAEEKWREGHRQFSEKCVVFSGIFLQYDLKFLSTFVVAVI